MSNIKEIKKESDVKQTLQECLDQADGLECVVILAIDNDGRQWLRTSSINQHKKSFLFCFFQAWMNKWFQLEDF